MKLPPLPRTEDSNWTTPFPNPNLNISNINNMSSITPNLHLLNGPLSSSYLPSSRPTNPSQSSQFTQK